MRNDQLDDTIKEAETMGATPIVKKPAGVKRGTPRKRNENVRKPRAARPSEIRAREQKARAVIPAPLSNDPVQEAYDYAKGVCERLRPLVKS